MRGKSRRGAREREYEKMKKSGVLLYVEIMIIIIYEYKRRQLHEEGKEETKVETRQTTEDHEDQGSKATAKSTKSKNK
jgi:hypothetical protein